MKTAVLHTVQLALADGEYAAALREALCRSCAWHVESVARPDPGADCVLVLDEAAFGLLPLPLSHPERIVLITRQDPQMLAQAWDAGLVSVLPQHDPMSTVLLAVMAAALRVANSGKSGACGGIPPNSDDDAAPLAPHHGHFPSRRCKIQ